MRLEDVTIIPIIEVVKVPEQPLGLNDPKILDQLKPTGQNIEGYDLYGGQFDDAIIFALVKDEQVLTAVIGNLITNFPDPNLKTIQIRRSWTPPELRNKGYSTALYDGLPRNGYRIISDMQVSDGALAIWKKLSQRREVKYFDSKTNEYTDKDPLKHPEVVFILEYAGWHHYPSIITENVYYTHDDIEKIEDLE